MSLTRFLRAFLTTVVAAGLLAVLGVLGLYLYVSPQLPDVSELKDMRLTTPMQVLTREGELIAEFGEQRRIPVHFADIPPLQVSALIAVEDQRFFKHGGVDLWGLLRIAIKNLSNDRAEGASTLTMQVARNYYLTRERTLTRKFTEIFLAMRIEAQFSKEEILEMYLNKVHFSHRAYGIAAAAQTYYGKKLDQLELHEMAVLAGIPKGESIYNPLSNPKRATDRRNHVLKRMLAEGFIDQAQHDAAVAQPVRASYHGPRVAFEAPYVAEMVRQDLIARYGEQRAYGDGLRVHTTVSSRLQKAAQTGLRVALWEYDKRHGWRGAEANWADALSDTEALYQKLVKLPVIADLDPAVVLTVEEKAVTLLTRSGEQKRIEWDGIKWARKRISENRRGPEPAAAADVLKPGDVIRYLKEPASGLERIAQIPDVAGALVALDPRDGGVLALVGGLDFAVSQFNRAVQARRQPGSNIKPFIYSAAFANGYTPATVVNDAPILDERNGGDDAWRPDNDASKFYGPVRLRFALTKSLNTISVRLFQNLGPEVLVPHLQRFGFPADQLPPYPSLALGGASELTPLEVARGYAAFANGGFLVTPFVIARIEDSNGNTLYSATPAQPCQSCQPGDTAPDGQLPRALDERVAYLTSDVMKDIIHRGTALPTLQASNSPLLKRSDLGGKTGTTNDARDAWFSGIHPHIAATVWVGFDDHRRPLGKIEYGGKAALPIWQYFMESALANEPMAADIPPPGVVSARIDPATGLLAPAGMSNALQEVFLAENVPTQTTRRSDDQDDPQQAQTPAPGSDDPIF